MDVETKAPIKLDRAQAAHLCSAWVRSLKDLERSVAKCRRKLSEPRVHDLRLACRGCVPVLEVMHELHPRDATWRTARRLVKGIGKALGPLRDAQVCQLLLKEGKSKDRRILMTKARKEERLLRPSVEAALDLVGRLPADAVRDVFRSDTPARFEELSVAISRLLARRTVRLKQYRAAMRLSDTASVHRARIALKWYRYLLLALEPCLTATQLRRLRALKVVQDTLGEQHDADLFRAWLKSTQGLSALPDAEFRSDQRRDRAKVRRMLDREWTL